MIYTYLVIRGTCYGRGLCKNESVAHTARILQRSRQTIDSGYRGTTVM
ncbi:hypothetical protein ACYSNW_05975 [Enterococcus sp. LJL99]